MTRPDATERRRWRDRLANLVDGVAAETANDPLLHQDLCQALEEAQQSIGRNNEGEGQ